MPHAQKNIGEYMRQAFIQLALVFAFLTQPLAAGAEQKANPSLLIGMPEWCPYTCTDEKNPGIMVEIARDIFKSHGIDPDFRVYDNWKRLLYDGRKGRVDAVLAVAPNEAPALIFPSEMMADAIITFFIRADEDWTFRNVQSFDGKVVISYDNVDYGPTIQPYIDDYKNDRSRVELATGETEEVLMRRMAAGRGDIYLEDRYVGLYMIKNQGLTDKVKEARSHRDPDRVAMGMAFSPKFKHATDYSELIDEGIRKMREDGSLQRIIERYVNE
jgi:polar amino acid transport system substrate-binding protein